MMNLKSTSPMQEGKMDAIFRFGIFISIVWLNWAAHKILTIYGNFIQCNFKNEYFVSKLEMNGKKKSIK